MGDLWPQWTAEITKDFKGGEDQLGIEGAAQSYQLYLVPGIISTTDHARYYGIYTWVLSRFIFLPNSTLLLKDFRGSFFKRHELALILASYSHHKEKGFLGGLVGSGNNNSGARELWESSDRLSLDSKYFENSLGGFGQYYRTAMQTMGLIEENDHPNWVYKLTPRGKALAEAYGQSIKGSTYAKLLAKAGSLAELSQRAATEYGEVGCICAEALATSKDRALLRDAFFRFDQQGAVANDHVRRRRTLGVALDLVHSARGRFERTWMDPALFLGEFRSGFRYHPVKRIADWVERWTMVEVRHLFTFALQCLWATFLLRLSDQKQGISLEDYLVWLRSIITDEVYSRPANAYLTDLCKAVGLHGSWQSVYASFDEACRQSTGRDEYSLYLAARKDSNDPQALAVNGLQILCQLYLRFLPKQRSGERIWQELASRERLPLTTFFDDLQLHLGTPACTVGDLLTWIYRDLILGQHEYIALSKLRQEKYDTFKFYYRDGRFYWPFLSADDYREPIRLPGVRLFNVLTILTDLGLVKADDNGCLALTGDGESYRQRVLAENSCAD